MCRPESGRAQERDAMERTPRSAAPAARPPAAMSPRARSLASARLLHAVARTLATFAVSRQEARGRGGAFDGDGAGRSTGAGRPPNGAQRAPRSPPSEPPARRQVDALEEKGRPEESVPEDRRRSLLLLRGRRAFLPYVANSSHRRSSHRRCSKGRQVCVRIKAPPSSVPRPRTRFSGSPELYT